MNKTENENDTQTAPGKPQASFLIMADGFYHSRHSSEEGAISEATHQINRGFTEDCVICRCVPIKRVRRPSVVIEKI